MAFTFLKTGAASAALAQKAAAEQELRRQEQGKMFRFYLKDKEEARITFIDGELVSGLLTPPRYYEHNKFLNGSWNNFFVCPEKTNPETTDKCPLCEDGDRSSLVALFTVLDHRQVQSKDKTKTYKDTKRLLVAKPQTFELLNRHAMKRGGLAGCTFDASRVGDKSAAVGSLFEFVEKNDIAALSALYMVERIDPKTNVKSKVTNFTPADYEKEITYRTAAQLREILKDTKGATPVGETPGGVDYSKNL